MQEFDLSKSFKYMAATKPPNSWSEMKHVFRACFIISAHITSWVLGQSYPLPPNDYAYGYQDYSNVPQNYYQDSLTYKSKPEYGEDYSDSAQDYWGVYPNDYSNQLGDYGTDYIGRCGTKSTKRKQCPKRGKNSRKCNECLLNNCWYFNNPKKKKNCKKYFSKRWKRRNGIRGNFFYFELFWMLTFVRL